MHPDQRVLNEAGYITKRFSPFHFQVKKPGGKDIVNVWPTAGKLLTKFQPGPAKYYSDIVVSVGKLLTPTRKTLKDLRDELFKLYPAFPENELYEWYKQDPITNSKEYGKVL